MDGANYDLYIPFLERAVSSAGGEGWLRDGGRLGLILSDRFLNVDYGEKLREKLPGLLRVSLVFDFRDTRVFAGALNYPAILIGERAGDGTEGELEAARVFSSDTELPELLEEFGRLRKRVPKGKAIRGKAVETFTFPRGGLKPEGWWLMPGDERGAFTTLRDALGKKLLELSASASGGFAGYQTSADPIFVLEEVQDSGEVLKVWPRHEGERCGCGKDPIEIEKAALRPFLFGRDVGRWTIDWKRTWVLFPYDVYRKKETLYGEAATVEGWNLIPTKENLGEFDFVEPKNIQTIEERFPKAWKYLQRHEAELRARENDRYDVKKPAGTRWYEATYPRGLEFYFRPKLVLQVLSRRPSFATDLEGRFVFAAGGTAGVYGIILDSIDPNKLLCIAAVLNSRAADFRVKEISSVFGSRFYSYGDQFIDEIVVPSSAIASPSVRSVAKALVSLVGERRRLAALLTDFPESYGSSLKEFELDSVSRLADKHPEAEVLRIEAEKVKVQKNLYAFEVHYGEQRPFEFAAREHAECLAEALRIRGRRVLRQKEIGSWRFPTKTEGCRKLLNLLEQTRKELAKVEAQTAERDEQLNEIVYRLYHVSREERKVIEAFLDRYSSRAAGALEEEDAASFAESAES